MAPIHRLSVTGGRLRALSQTLHPRDDFVATQENWQQYLYRSVSADIWSNSADFHTSLNDTDLRVSREYHALKQALFQGGITEETLSLLISASPNARKDSGVDAGNNNFGFSDPASTQLGFGGVNPSYRDVSWRSIAPPYSHAPSSVPFSNPMFRGPSGQLRGPAAHRQASFEIPFAADDHCFEDDEQSHIEDSGRTTSGERRTLFFSGLSERTTYSDLLSVIKGGKVLSVVLRTDRSALVTLMEGAADFLAWVKRNDIYLGSKRIEVKWADRQFNVNSFTSGKVVEGATRNVVIRHAVDKGLTETRIRDDMDHINNLIVISVTFKGADAYVSMNSIHNALFARTCMKSRKEYKGCRIDFYPDECDVPLPARTLRKYTVPEPVVEKKPLANRFGMLDLDGVGGSSDEENKVPEVGDNSEGDSDGGAGVGVSLAFLDS